MFACVCFVDAESDPGSADSLAGAGESQRAVQRLQSSLHLLSEG